MSSVKPAGRADVRGSRRICPTVAAVVAREVDTVVLRRHRLEAGDDGDRQHINRAPAPRAAAGVDAATSSVLHDNARLK